MTDTVSASVHTLYRFWDKPGSLLYVGITVRPWQRWKEHRGEKAWWHEVATVTIENFGSHEEVAAAELRAIQHEEPRYNIRGRALASPPSNGRHRPVADWDFVHTPVVASIGDLLWCTCAEPDWDAMPDVSRFDAGYGRAQEEWVAAQPYYEPGAYSAHVLAAVLGERFAVQEAETAEFLAQRERPALFVEKAL